MKQHHRNCSACKKPIAKTHRWRQTWHRFLFWTWRTYSHHHCDRPESGPAKPRLKGEVPLPFPEVDSTTSQSVM